MDFDTQTFFVTQSILCPQGAIFCMINIWYFIDNIFVWPSMGTAWCPPKTHTSHETFGKDHDISILHNQMEMDSGRLRGWSEYKDAILPV